MPAGEFAVDEMVERQMAQQPAAVDPFIPRFFLEQVKNERKSKQAGHPVFDDIEMVEILKPGEKNTIPILPVSDEYRERWPAQYERFKRGHEEVEVEGTPLEQWAAIEPGMVRSFKEGNVHSVDQLAMVPDGALKNLGMGAVRLKQKAKEFIEWRDGAASTTALQEQNADMAARLEHLEEKLEGVMAENARLAAEVTGKQDQPKLSLRKKKDR